MLLNNGRMHDGITATKKQKQKNTSTSNKRTVSKPFPVHIQAHTHICNIGQIRIRMLQDDENGFKVIFLPMFLDCESVRNYNIIIHVS